MYGLKKGVSLQCLLSRWSKNLKLRTLTKYQSLNSLLTVNKCLYNFYFFGFTFLDLLIKLMKMRLLYILYCPPPPPLQRDGKDLLIPLPSCILYRSPPPILPSYWLVHWPITQSRFWPQRGEGGDRYNTTTCRMAEDSKGPCISHVDASHGEWPRIESSLLFCIFFILSKS